jgi:hypothetical protein
MDSARSKCELDAILGSHMDLSLQEMFALYALDQEAKLLRSHTVAGDATKMDLVSYLEFQGTVNVDFFLLFFLTGLSS